MKKGKRFSSLVAEAAIKKVDRAWNLLFSLAFGVTQWLLWNGVSEDETRDKIFSLLTERYFKLLTFFVLFCLLF